MGKCTEKQLFLQVTEYRLTFHSKPETANPPAAPDPAIPTKRPLPTLLDISEAPI